ncbi:hypothetical protein HN843_01545, partial [bacterium]|nr:hypothetical protein [bacterium]
MISEKLAPQHTVHWPLKNSLYLSLIILLGAVLRFIHLDNLPMWIDEYALWKICNPGPGHSFIEQLLDNYQSPLFMVAIWNSVQGVVAEWQMRLPSVIAGIFTIPLIFTLATDLFDRRSGWIAAFLTAISPFHIWYSQDGRGYSFMIFFAACATLLLFKLIENKLSLKYYLFYGLTLALMVLSNQSAMFLIVAHLLVIALFNFPTSRIQFLQWAVAFVFALILVSPWLLKAFGIIDFGRALPGATADEVLRGAGNFSLMGVPFALHSMFYGFSIGPTLFELHRPDRIASVIANLSILIPSTLLAVIIFGRGVIVSKRRSVVLVIIIVPLLLLIFLSIKNIKVFNPRYLASVFPVFISLAAFGLSLFKIRVRAVLGCLLITLFLLSLFGYYFDREYNKRDLRIATSFVAERSDKEDVIIVPVSPGLFELYYNGVGEVETVWDPPVINSKSDAVEVISILVKDHEFVWLIDINNWKKDPNQFM